MPKIVAQTPVGKEVDVVVVRDGKELTKKITLGRLDEREAKAGKPEEAKPQAPPAAGPKMLGLELLPLDARARAKFQVKDGVKNGALIVKVDPDTPRRRAETAPGEIITEINRTPVAAPEDVRRR